MASKRVLIIDDCQEQLYIATHPWSDLIDEDDDIDLYVLTSTGALSEKDKSCSRIRAYKEIDHPTTDGTLELWAFEMHKKHSFTHVYTKSEDLMIRAAHLRSLFNITTGLTAETIPFYREKVQMKELASQNGFPVPPFARLYAPSDLLGFIAKHGYPVVTKPTVGCATSGLNLIKDEAELETFLSTTLFKSIDTDQRMDLVGEFLVEGFMPGCMYHVNGIAKNGQLIHAWPFSYLHTCLDFRKDGSTYGNAFIPQSDPRHDRLLKTTQRILDILPSPSDGLAFHLELYENMNENRLPDDDYVLCEIAGRAPGGSITHLMDLVSFSGDEKQSFARLDFRVSVSLPIPTIPDVNENKVITDLMVPRRVGKPMFMPQECPIANLKYIPVTDLDNPTVYGDYEFNGLNVTCRFIAQTETMEEGRELVEKGYEWFEMNYIHVPPDEPYPVTLVRELHRFIHSKMFA